MNIGSTHAIGGKIEVETLSAVSVQFQPINSQNMEDVGKNVDQILEFMDRAVAGFPGLDLFVSPECALQGAHAVRWPEVLVDLDGPEVRRIRDKCREWRIWGIFGLLARNGDGKTARNMGILVSDRGEIVLEYVKMNPWIPGEITHPGWECPVAGGPKGSRIGILICSDGDFPEMWREAAFNGANIIVRISRYMAPWDKAWEITNKAGAYCNQCYVVTANSVGMDEEHSFFGRSMILNPDGAILTEAPYGVPGMIKADLYPQLIDQMRRKSVTGNFLYSFRHRGASCPDYEGEGDTRIRYNAYDPDKKPVLP